MNTGCTLFKEHYGVFKERAEQAERGMSHGFDLFSFACKLELLSSVNIRLFFTAAKDC